MKRTQWNGITILLIAALIAVALPAPADVDRYTATPAETMARAAKMADESPIVLQTISAPAQEVAGASLGLRLTF